MKKLTAASLALLAGMASANADVRLNLNGLQNPTTLGLPSQNDRGPGYFAGFEAAQGYVIGNIAGQNGWSDNAPRGVMRVEGPGQGNGSPNAQRLSLGTQAQGAFGQSFTPLLTPGFRNLSVDVRMNDNGGGNYGVAGFLGANTSFRVEFDYRGNIFFVNFVTNTFVDTGIAWAQNQYRTLTLAMGPGGINASYGASNFLIPLNAAGDQGFEALTLYHDNYQAFGAGPFPGSTGPTAAYFDNLGATNAIPAPAAAGLLGLGGLIAARRRRA